MGPPQVGNEIGPLELVDPWIGYQVFKKKKFDIVLEEHKYESLKYEPINSKLGSMFQSLGLIRQI